LASAIAVQILSAPEYTVFDHVEFTLEDATVVLGGSVTTDAKKQHFESLIANVPGVRSVQSELRVLSSSSEQQRMRERLFKRIYEDSSFAEFADDANPPVHIIVESAHVTLTGIVDTRLLRMSAEAIVRGTFGVRSVRNEIRVRE
jgi:osmotically-inducible protein OsmY